MFVKLHAQGVIMKHRVIYFSLAFILFMFACNLPGGQQEPPTSIDGIATQAALTVAAAQNTAAVQSTATSTSGSGTLPTNTPIAQPTVQGSVTNTPVCNQASFVADVTIPDNTNINVNAGFTKTWRLRNVGSCTWTSGYQIIFDSGDQMSGPASQQLINGTVLPGATVDVSINLTAPGSAGTYKGNWKLRDANGSVFALSTGPFWVQIKAVTQAQEDDDSWPTFKNGDSGPEVRAIQLLLTAHGYDLNVDGIFGPITQARVEDFQTDKNITEEDGFVGPITWPKLIIQASQGKTGPEVRAIQNLLKNKFGYNITVDGIFGIDTKNAVKDYQSDHGLVADGIVGPITWNSLISE
jgi:peptidoglycan hydrolase-like protein with peptidoglycan-binding domain